jgi:hypothetical protein
MTDSPAYAVLQTESPAILHRVSGQQKDVRLQHDAHEEVLASPIRIESVAVHDFSTDSERLRG